MPNVSPVNSRAVNAYDYGPDAVLAVAAIPTITAALAIAGSYDSEIAFAGVQPISGAMSLLATPQPEIAFSGLVSIDAALALHTNNHIAFAGSLAVNGSLGLAAGGPKIALAGVGPTFTGAMALAAGAGATLGFDAVLSPRGSLKVTAAIPSVAFAASPAVTATLAATAAPPSVAIAASPSIAGTLAATAVGTRIAMAGNPAIAAALAVTSSGPSVAFAGNPSIAASLGFSAVVPGIALAGSGMGLAGTLEATAAAPSIAFAAVPSISASLRLRDDAAWVAFAATPTITAATALAAASTGIGLSGSPTITAALGATAAAPSVAFAGIPTLSASLALASASQTVAFAGTPSIAAALAATADVYHATAAFAATFPAASASLRVLATPAGPVPDVGAEPTLGKIIKAVQRKLIADGVADAQCCLVVEDTEPFNAWGSPFVTLWPGPQSIVGPDVEGGGRSANSYQGELHIRCYVRNQMDPIGTDPGRLLDSSPTFGLLALCKAVMSSLQEYLPSDEYNRLLVTDTMICSSQAQPHKYQRTRDFLWTTVPYRICYNEILSPDGTYQCSYTP